MSYMSYMVTWLHEFLACEKNFWGMCLKACNRVTAGLSQVSRVKFTGYTAGYTGYTAGKVSFN